MSFPSSFLRQVDDRSSNTAAASSHLDEVPHLTSELAPTSGALLPVPGKLTPTLAGVTLNRPTRLLINVNVERSFGPVHVVVSPENSVGELIKTVVETYVKEKRRPLLAEPDSQQFELHYSQFSLESLRPEEKLMNLGSRNFFLCTKQSNNAASSVSRLNEARAPFALTRFMDLLQ